MQSIESEAQSVEVSSHASSAGSESDGGLEENDADSSAKADRCLISQPFQTKGHSDIAAQIQEMQDLCLILAEIPLARLGKMRTVQEVVESCRKTRRQREKKKCSNLTLNEDLMEVVKVDPRQSKNGSSLFATEEIAIGSADG